MKKLIIVGLLVLSLAVVPVATPTPVQPNPCLLHSALCYNTGGPGGY